MSLTKEFEVGQPVYVDLVALDSHDGWRLPGGGFLASSMDNVAEYLGEDTGARERLRKLDEELATKYGGLPTRPKRYHKIRLRFDVQYYGDIARLTGRAGRVTREISVTTNRIWR